MLGRAGLAFDSEWPPRNDPPWGSIGAGLTPGIIDAAMPAEIGVWLEHIHEVPWMSYPGRFAVGDVTGDGRLELVVYMPHEMVAALRLDVDWTATPPTAQLTPLWAMLLPYAVNHLNATPPAQDSSHPGLEHGHFVIWDFDGDGVNEVVIPGSYDQTPPTDAGMESDRYVYVLKTNPSASGPGPYFSVPEPRVCATLKSVSGAYLEDRVGICRIRDDGFDIVCHGHSGTNITILQLSHDAQTDTYALNCIANRRQVYEKAVHEWGYADADGDGYDEFFMGGMVDFRDAGDPPPSPANKLSGVLKWPLRWNVGNPQHCDTTHVGDFLPDHPGLELWTTPEGAWIDGTGRSHANGWPIMIDAATGAVLVDESSPGYDCPITHGQAGYPGNWTATENGLEIIFYPKDWHIMPGDQLLGEGGVMLNDQGRPLVCDGMMTKPPGGWRCGGPVHWVSQIDWDGDYSQDELLNHYRAGVNVWRLGQKGDWGAGSSPPGMPSQQQNQDGWLENSVQRHWFWYYDVNLPGHGDYENGGPGAYTHYYHKLLENSPGGQYFDLFSINAYDVGGDYREEVLTVDGGKLRILYNPAPLDEPLRHPSPALSESYRRMRQEFHECVVPFQYACQPILASIEVTPDTLEMAANSEEQLRAVGHYSDGVTVVDVTGKVSWHIEPNDCQTTVNSLGMVETGEETETVAVTATTNVMGIPVVSNTVEIRVAAETTHEELPAANGLWLCVLSLAIAFTVCAWPRSARNK
jgi:hypothetical protein